MLGLSAEFEGTIRNYYYSEKGKESVDTITLSFVAIEMIERQTEIINHCFYILYNLFYEQRFSKT